MAASSTFSPAAVMLFGNSSPLHLQDVAIMFLDEADAMLPLIDDDAGLETHDFMLLLDHIAVSCPVCIPASSY